MARCVLTLHQECLLDRLIGGSSDDEPSPSLGMRMADALLDSDSDMDAAMPAGADGGPACTDTAPMHCAEPSGNREVARSEFAFQVRLPPPSPPPSPPLPSRRPDLEQRQPLCQPLDKWKDWGYNVNNVKNALSAEERRTGLIRVPVMARSPHVPCTDSELSTSPQDPLSRLLAHFPPRGFDAPQNTPSADLLPKFVAPSSERKPTKEESSVSETVAACSERKIDPNVLAVILEQFRTRVAQEKTRIAQLIPPSSSVFVWKVVPDDYKDTSYAESQVDAVAQTGVRFKVGITASPSWRWEGGVTPSGNVVVGHKEGGWRFMTVVSLRKGNSGRTLEIHLIDYAFDHYARLVDNRVRGGGGKKFCRNNSEFNFLYIVHM